MIKEALYKGRPAIELSCSEFTALFLPLDGAKLASFKTKTGHELFVQAEGEAYRRLDLVSDYEKSECSGFDDMFPTIDACVINGFQYLDHGEVCRRRHHITIGTDQLAFSCALPELNVHYEKTVYCDNGALFIKYTIKNNNNFDFPYVWAAHMMFQGEEGAYAVSCFPPDAPKTFLAGNPDRKAPHILPPRGNKEYKYYYCDAKAPLICGMVYPKSGTQITVEFDNDIVKYLGLWVNPGDLNGMYTIAVEPCTALYDSPIMAEKANAASCIKANQKVEFTLKMSYKNIHSEELLGGQK